MNKNVSLELDKLTQKDFYRGADIRWPYSKKERNKLVWKAFSDIANLYLRG